MQSRSPECNGTVEDAGQRTSQNCQPFIMRQKVKVIYTLLVIAAIGLVSGCSVDHGEDFADREHQAARDAAEGVLNGSKSNAPESVPVTDSEEAENASPIEAFAARFAEQFNVDRKKTFEDLVYWEGISDSDRELNMKLYLRTDDFIEGLDGKVRGKPGYQVFEEYKSFVKYLQLPNSTFATPPTYLVMLNIVNANESITQIWYPVVNVDGRFYICASARVVN